MKSNEVKKLFEFIHCEKMGDIVTELYYHNNIISLKDKSLITEKIKQTAYRDACLAYLGDLKKETNSWFDILHCDLSKYYGKSLRRILLEKEVE